MIKYHVLGRLELRGADGRLLHSFLAGPKRSALLTYLLLAHPRGFHRRDVILPLFWPERSPKRARGALRNMLHEIRRALGEGVVVNRGAEEVGIAENVLWCDALAFDHAFATGRLEEAVELYQGEVLDGFHLSGASPGFERWLDAERGRIARRYGNALEQLAGRAEESGDHVAAAEWWRRRAAAEPHSGPVARGLMAALERTGDRAGAVRHAESYRRFIVEEFGGEPDPAVFRLADRMRTPSLELVGSDSRSETTDSEPSHTEAPPPARSASIVVLPFANFGADPADEYLSDGMTEELIHRLVGIDRLRVAARTSAFMFKNEKVDVREVGRRLGVAHVLEGSVRRAGEQVRITAQLIEVSTGYHLWSEAYQRDLEDVFAVQDEIGRKIVEAIRAEFVGPERLPLGDASGRVNAPASFAAFDLYLKGRHLLHQRTAESIQRAVRYFEDAIQSDANYARAYTGLADAYLVLGSGTYGTLSPREALGRAEHYAEKAITLDRGLVEAHVSTGVARMHAWNWSGAEAMLRRAIELGPGYAPAHHRYGWLLALQGRFDRAIDELERAAELDPLSLLLQTAVGRVYQFMGQPDAAIRRYRGILETAPSYVGAHIGLGLAFLDKRMMQEAVAALRHARTLAGETPAVTAALAGALAVAGERKKANALLEELMAQSKRDYVSPAQIASVHGLLGQMDEAFVRFDQAVEQRCPSLVYCKVSPPPGGWWDPIRSDPRYDRLLRRVGLVGEA